MRNIFILICVILVGCSQPTKKPNHVDTKVVTAQDPLVEMLSDAAQDVSKATDMLAQTQNALSTELLDPKSRRQALKDATTVPPRMDRKASLRWNGPLSQAVYRIAKLANYRVRILGQPVQPVMVRVDSKNVPIIVMFRQIKHQAGKRAVISVYENLIQVSYAGT